LVTPDEIDDLQALELQTRLNGQIVQQDKLGHMLFSVAQLIAYISSFTELLPGDVIATGTPAGVGALRQPPLFLKPGDHLEVDIQQIGLLSNDLIADNQGEGE
jgi:2-keto-4-pentenoate hydratase/2-oxohepta-3-ene-1,7-dioic acid hydratase in catechol pathway